MHSFSGYGMYTRRNNAPKEQKEPPDFESEYNTG
jgi:hypothetical protein